MVVHNGKNTLFICLLAGDESLQVSIQHCHWAHRLVEACMCTAILPDPALFKEISPVDLCSKNTNGWVDHQV